MDRTIIGRFDEKTISETIQNYLADIPEQELTAKKKIAKSLQSWDMIQDISLLSNL